MSLSVASPQEEAKDSGTETTFCDCPAKLRKDKMSKHLTPGKDKAPIASFDTTTASGTPQDVSDRSLDFALETSRRAGLGEYIPAKATRRLDLEKRIKQAQLVETESDPQETPLDQSMTTEDVVFKDVDDDGQETETGDDNPDDDEPTFTDPTGEPVMATSDPTQWIVAAISTIHKDIQQIKPLIAEIPVVRVRVDEIQSVLGEITTGFIEMKNSITNMEATVTKNRLDISKLTDLIKSIKIETPQPLATPAVKQTRPQETKTADKNLDLLVISLSKKKSMSPDQEIALRAALLSHNKESILETLGSLGTMRPIMSAELDKLLQMDTGSNSSMQGVLKVLLGVLRGPGRSDDTCPEACKPPIIVTPSQEPTRASFNPFKLKK